MRRQGRGSCYKRGDVWWVKYYRHGKPYRESANSLREKDAIALLTRRLGQIQSGTPIVLKAERITVGELLTDLVTDYEVNRRASLDRMKELVAHLRDAFDVRKAVAVTTADVNLYIADRQKALAANATVNRELAALKHAYTLGLRAQKILAKPYIPMLQEDNVRQGFFEREQFEAVRRHLAPPLRPLVTVAYITGWRVPSELQTLQWRQVDFAAGLLRLEPGSTKNKDGRLFPFTAELRAVLEAQKAATDELTRKTGRIIPWVFHRNGKPIKKLYRAWETACNAAGVPGRIMHDFRRTAVRNLERAGVSRSVAMKMTGHKTEAVYRRYAIVSESDLHEAAVKLGNSAERALGTITGTVRDLRAATVS